MDEFAEGKRYLWVIPDDLKETQKVQHLVFCSGQVYYDAFEARKKRNDVTTALVRLEQLSPFPYDAVEKELRRYPNAKVTWLQEEHQNAGAYHFVRQRIPFLFQKLGRDTHLNYCGRVTSASPATGSGQ